MMTFSIGEDKKTAIEAQLRGIGIYLDNFALIEIANEKTGYRDRFLRSLHKNGTLLFSWANSHEIIGPKGGTAKAIRSFLDDIGNHWLPLEFSPWEIQRRELTGDNPISEVFMNAFCKDRLPEISKGKELILSSSFFNLSRILDWTDKNYMEDVIKRVEKLRSRAFDDYAREPSSLDNRFPRVSYDRNKPGTFVFNHLFRVYVQETKGYKFDRNDALDLCHAVAASYGTLITLDKEWKRRFSLLPQPNHLPKVYYGPELNQFVDEFEKLVA